MEKQQLTPGLEYLNNLAEVNSTWQEWLGDAAIRVAISDDVEAEYDLLDEINSLEQTVVTEKDFEEFICGQASEITEEWNSNEGVHEFDAVFIARAIELADTECFMDLLKERFQNVYEAVIAYQ
jgi:hypothetical protein